MSENAAEATPRTGPVLGVYAHPDDAEISAGGTLAKWCQAGREVHLLVLTNGDRGSNDRSRDRAELAATRLIETEAAADVLGLSSVRSLGIPDGELANNQEVREAVIRRIREVRAETVVSVDPTAWFLAEFVGDTPWIHLDIAGPAWAEKVSDLGPKGGTGVPVRTLVRYLLDQSA